MPQCETHHVLSQFCSAPIFRNPLAIRWFTSDSTSQAFPVACGRLIYNCRPVFELSLQPTPILPSSVSPFTCPSLNEQASFLLSAALSTPVTMTLWESDLVQLNI
uniref:Uncharacterized protein n=1 Tax=Knipowitschia caucasica TaxID=637954 RepID=A0AAV2MC49_KNICA